MYNTLFIVIKMELKENLNEIGKSTDLLYVADYQQDDMKVTSPCTSRNMCLETSEQVSAIDNTIQPRKGFDGLHPIISRVFLISLMILIVTILQIPTILYFTELPDDSVSLLDSIDFDTCSVS